jgi:hypothetical protein
MNIAHASRVARGIACAAALCAGTAVAADFEAPYGPPRGAREAVADEPGQEAPAAPARPRNPVLIDLLQMFNPFAPREYGGGDDSLVYREEEAPAQGTAKDRKARGFRIFSIVLW